MMARQRIVTSPEAGQTRSVKWPGHHAYDGRGKLEDLDSRDLRVVRYHLFRTPYRERAKKHRVWG